jgi:hypothetical protein
MCICSKRRELCHVFHFSCHFCQHRSPSSHCALKIYVSCSHYTTRFLVVVIVVHAIRVLPVKRHRNTPDIGAFIYTQEIQNASLGAKAHAQLIVHFDVSEAVDFSAFTLRKVRSRKLDAERDKLADTCRVIESESVSGKGQQRPPQPTADWEKITLNVSMSRCKFEVARVNVDGELQIASQIPRRPTDRMADVGLLGDNGALGEAPVHVTRRSVGVVPRIHVTVLFAVLASDKGHTPGEAIVPSCHATGRLQVM